MFAFANSRTGQLRPQCKLCTNAMESSRLASRRLADGVAPSHRCCSKCGESKPLTNEFFKNGKRYKFGLSNECKPCLRDRNVAWVKNTPKGQATAKRCADKRRELAREYGREYQKSHKAQYAQNAKAWRERNPERAKELAREFGRKNKAKRTEYRHGRRAAGQFSYSVVPALKELQKGKCAICRNFLSSLIEVDHIMPIALGGTNESSNLQLLCRTCNRSKGAKHPVDYMQSKGFLL